MILRGVSSCELPEACSQLWQKLLASNSFLDAQNCACKMGAHILNINYWHNLRINDVVGKINMYCGVSVFIVTVLLIIVA
jgi:hypothetical protein